MNPWQHFRLPFWTSTRSARPRRRTALRLESLEQRLLLAAELPVSPREIVFVDSAVPQAAVLEAGVLRGAAVVELTPGRDGVQQIADVLSRQHDLSAIHILSHGSAGTVDLGTAQLDAATLPSYAGALRQWGQALAPGGDLLLYGCDVAAGSSGAAFLTTVAALTGAHVAASTDVTGAAGLGGNWGLEAQQGPVHTPGVIAAAAEQAWDHTLLPPPPLFTDSGVSLTGVAAGSVAWGDYDNDGHLDLLLTGDTSSGSPITKLYHNNGNGTFSDSGITLPGVYKGSVAWGDYDNDGKLDFLLTGDTKPGRISKVYHNNGNGTFSDSGISLPGVSDSSVAWGDYNNDGKLDFLLTGYTGSAYISKVYHNNGNGTFSDSGIALPGVAQGSVAWGDYDNDGKLDFLLTGSSSGGLISKLYHNNGNGTFSASSVVLPGVYQSSVAWGDYDNDGHLDLLLTGRTSPGTSTSKLYHNNGNGTFSDSGLVLPSVDYSSVAWGDYDNDGNLDFLLTGQSSGYLSKVYHNNGNGTFSDSGISLTGVRLSSAAWGDYDNDGKLDFLLTGYKGSNTDISTLYHNNGTIANDPPAAPTGLSATVNSLTSVTFSWTGPSDGQTPTLGLSYALRVGTTPGGSDVLSPPADTSTGFRLTPTIGLVQTTSWTLTGLTPGQTYYWSVQAIDPGLAGGSFATEAVFHTILHLAVSAPSTAQVGSAFTFTVTARDEFNHTATGYTGTVHFSSNDPDNPGLPANSTLTNGVRTFSATLNTSGSRTLTATDTVTPSITGTATVTVAAPQPPPPPPTFIGSGVLSASVGFDSLGRQVQAVVFSSTQLWIYDSTGAHFIGTGVLNASVAFDPSGQEILDVVFASNELWSYDASGAHFIGNGVQSVSVTFDGQGRQVTAAVFAGGGLYVFDAAGAHFVAPNVQSVSIAFDASGQEVLELVYVDTTLYQFDAAGAHFIGSGVQAVGVAFNFENFGQRALDVVFASGDLWQY